MTRSNLGNALRALGARESGTQRLVEAVAAYRLALHELRRARLPLDWATTQNSLGAALRVVGGREGAATRPEKATTLRDRLRERLATPP